MNFPTSDESTAPMIQFRYILILLLTTSAERMRVGVKPASG